MAETTIKGPKNKTEEAALEKALAEYKLTRIDAVEAFLDGEAVQAFRAEVEKLLEDGLPAGSTAFGHVSQLTAFLDRAKASLAADRTVLNNVISPPAPPTTIGADAPLPAPPPPVA